MAEAIISTASEIGDSDEESEETPTGVSNSKSVEENDDKEDVKKEDGDISEDKTDILKIDGSDEELECAVCLQKCVHPVRLPCKHIFCFLCVKGVANQSKRCAMCRQEIPADFLDHPILLNSSDLEKTEETTSGYQWFYEGRNGWWQYDERTSTELEAAYGDGQRACEVLVAGFLYIIDFDRMIQLRRNDPSRRRRIKRDLSSIPKKGIAGIKFPGELTAQLNALSPASVMYTPNTPLLAQELSDHTVPVTSTVNSNNNNNNTINNNNDLCPPTPTAPSNTPQTPHTPSTASSGSGSPDTDHHHLLLHQSDLHYHHHHHHHHHHHSHQSNVRCQYPQCILSSTDTPPSITAPSTIQINEITPSITNVEQCQTDHPTTSAISSSPQSPQSSGRVTDGSNSLEDVRLQMNNLSLTSGLEFYPLDGVEETEQYHLPSDDETN